MPAVTILMAVYNAEAFLQEALDSIYRQTLTDFELLVVDDGSTDRTGEILKRQIDARLRIIENDRNIGLPASLNRALSQARGRYVARLDGDDICEPERLAKQVAWLDSRVDTILVGSSYYEISETGRILKMERLPATYIDIAWGLLFYSPFVHSALMLRWPEFSEQVGKYSESLSYSTDYDLCYRAALRAPVENIDDRHIWRQDPRRLPHACHPSG